MKAFYALCILINCQLLTARFSIPKAQAQNFDIDLLHDINSGNTKSWDQTNKLVSQSMTPISIAAPASVWFYGMVAKDSAAKRNGLVMGTGLLASGIITIGMKYAVNRTRPFNSYPFIVKKADGGGPSFPSGHTSSAFATATSLSLCYPKWYVITPSFLWASAVGYSRMELGVHYPSDVFVGALVGAGCSWFTWKLNKKLQEKK